MWAFLLLIIVAFALLILFLITTIKTSYKVLKNYVKNKILLGILSCVPLLIIVLGLWIDMINAMVIYLHLMIIICLIKLLLLMIKKVWKKEIHKNIALVIGALLTVILMTRAHYLAYHVQETDYEVLTSKNIGMDKFRIVQISDSHLGTTIDGEKFTEYMQEINQLKPDIVVVTGDFIDDDTPFTDLEQGAKGLGELKTTYGVYFVFGNHDKGYYQKRDYDEKDLREALEKNHVRILEDECVEITDNIILIGRQDKQVKDRKTIQDLVKNLDKNKFLIDLNHQPNDYDNEMKAGVDLVLSGHTHGGQLIPLGQLGVLLGANDKVYGMEKRENTTFIVNAGISDWAIKFKTGTVSEYGVIDVKEK